MTNQISKQSKVKKAFQLHQEIIQLGNSVGKAFILIGQRLKEIKENNLFRNLGEGGYDTFESYLASPELQIGRRQAYYFISIYATYCEKYGVKIEDMEGAKWTGLAESLQVVNEKNYEDWLQRAKSLSISDIKIEVRRELSGIDPEECDHDWEKKTYFQCKKCGERSWVPVDNNKK